MCPRCCSDSPMLLSHETDEPETGYRALDQRAECKVCRYVGDVEEFDVDIFVDGEPIKFEKLPAFCREEAKNYFLAKLPPGSGWRAILSNDLRAVVYCDDETVRALPTIWRWLHNYAPPSAWGSPEKVEEWLEGRNAGVHPTLRPIVNSVARLSAPEFRHNAATREGL